MFLSFTLICMLISVVMFGKSIQYDDWASAAGWLMAFGFQAFVFLRDLFGDKETPELHKAIEKEKKRIQAFNKLMNRG